MKFEFRGYIKAANDGLSVEEAMRKVQADWERMEALARELGQGPAAKPSERPGCSDAGSAERGCCCCTGAAATARASARAAGEAAVRAFFFPLSQPGARTRRPTLVASGYCREASKSRYTIPLAD